MCKQYELHPVKESAVQKLDLTRQIVDRALLYELRAVFQIDGLLRGDRQEADRAAQPVQRTGFGQGRRAADKIRGLRVVPAGMHRACGRIGLRMLRANDGVLLRDDRNDGAGTAGIDLRREAGNVSGQRHLIPKRLEDIRQIARGLPLLIADLRVLPDRLFNLDDQTFVFFYTGKNAFDSFVTGLFHRASFPAQLFL